MGERWWSVVAAVVGELDASGITYCLIGTGALIVQGVDLPDGDTLEVAVQWDQFPDAHRLFQPQKPGPIDPLPRGQQFRFHHLGVLVTVACTYNTVVAADPERVLVHRDGRQAWAKSVRFYRRELPPDDQRHAAIASFLRALQTEHSRINREAWSETAYEAWVHRFGSPREAATRIAQDPEARLQPLNQYLGVVSGRKVGNLLGSHGTKAVALALLGAEVTVVDISAENARYALELAAEAGVTIRYVVADVLALPPAELTGDYDIVLMELGILHYFVDLEPLAETTIRLLRSGGRLVLQDFHPVSTKLITSKGRKHRVTGNYFDAGVEETGVAYGKHVPDGSMLPAKKARLRKWTLGEIVTAIAEAGLCLRLLDEEPNTKLDDAGIPKTFTLVAEKL